MNDSITVKQAWEVPTLTALGDLEALTASGSPGGSEDGPAFTSF
jgi:hypothetical protein